MNESKVLRVVGLSSSLPLDAANPLNPMNRRISLVVLNEKTERQIRGLPEEPMPRRPANDSPSRRAACEIRSSAQESAAALHAAPLALLLGAKVLGATQRWRFVGVLRTPVREVALVRVVAADRAQRLPATSQ